MSRLLVVIPDDVPAEMAGSPALKDLEQYARVVVHNDRAEDTTELFHRIRAADAVVNVRAFSRFTADLLEQCPKLKLISILGTGTDNVDLDAAARHGVAVTTTPGVTAIQVAEHALALMLAAARQIPQKDRDMRTNAWPRGQILQLYGKTLGILGTGLIGRQVARLGKGIGMNVIAWTFHPDPALAESIGLSYVDRDDLFRQADIVSVHLRLTPETSHLIGAREFALMKKTAILVNTARGAICDEAELVEALAAGRIAAAGLDVFAVEPLPDSHPLTRVDNVVLTPHNGGMSREAVVTGAEQAVANVLNFFAGRPTNVITHPRVALSGGDQ